MKKKKKKVEDIKLSDLPKKKVKAKRIGGNDNMWWGVTYATWPIKTEREAQNKEIRASIKRREKQLDRIITLLEKILKGM